MLLKLRGNMSLQRSKKDLEIAAKEIEKMASTTAFPELEEAWQNFLGRIERSWEIADRILRKENGYQQFIKKYKILRDKDPLLTYLKQARNAETHAVSGTVDVAFQVMVFDKIGRPFQVDEIKITNENGILSINIDAKNSHAELDAKLLPCDPKLVKFKNRGIVYDVPEKHLDYKIKNMHPVIIAKLGHQFYEKFIVEAKTFIEEKE